MIHPSLPPQQVNTTFARQKAERVGGSGGLGDERDLEEGASEFAPRVVVKRGADGMEVDEEDEEDEEVERTLVASAAAMKVKPAGAGQDGQGEKMIIEEQEVVDSAKAPNGASTFGTAAGFASFAAVKKVEVVAAEEDSSDEEEDVIPAFVEAVLPAVATGVAGRQSGDDEEDSSDDEAMPTINVDSDDE